MRICLVTLVEGEKGMECTLLHRRDMGCRNIGGGVRPKEITLTCRMKVGEKERERVAVVVVLQERCPLL